MMRWAKWVGCAFAVIALAGNVRAEDEKDDKKPAKKEKKQQSTARDKKTVFEVADQNKDLSLDKAEFTEAVEYFNRALEADKKSKAKKKTSRGGGEGRGRSGGRGGYGGRGKGKYVPPKVGFSGGSGGENAASSGEGEEEEKDDGIAKALGGELFKEFDSNKDDKISQAEFDENFSKIARGLREKKSKAKEKEKEKDG